MDGKKLVIVLNFRTGIGKRRCLDRNALHKVRFLVKADFIGKDWPLAGDKDQFLFLVHPGSLVRCHKLSGIFRYGSILLK